MDDRFTKIKEATYLSTDKSSTYRAILRHFYLQRAGIDHPLLSPLVERLKQTGAAGYQEALLEQYVADLEKG